MKSLIQVAFLFSFVLGGIQTSFAEENNVKNNLLIISLYQIEDDTQAGFDFFTSLKSHKCGGKLSNRYRSYSDNQEVAKRKFQLVLAALNFKHKVSIKSLGCEGRSMLVDYIGISH
ncbi:MAG: hypothetical protein KBT75_16675 [Oleispira antarctica]|uniref:Uncharacterized protein n=1 Tax=Oleispira antarctica RB-8 TaxID=698738 RepID=R4YRE5_OLEAN|nr:hypothetical protein [Oleispira antarctica]MBQ0793900.1 hypothetical protein [Oleispira antarctica]CCK74679.1 conserved hypothetical protein [Oleispira antarctica RB-8]|tara:strand:+ start:3296 stop:3643 length:348 start_codon:yes stop_codon:yes gene_type:complete